MLSKSLKKILTFGLIINSLDNQMRKALKVNKISNLNKIINKIKIINLNKIITKIRIINKIKIINKINLKTNTIYQINRLIITINHKIINIINNINNINKINKNKINKINLLAFKNLNHSSKKKIIIKNKIK